MNHPITVTTSRVTGPPASLPIGFPRTARIFLWATRKSAREPIAGPVAGERGGGRLRRRAGIRAGGYHKHVLRDIHSVGVSAKSEGV